ncbi:hemolymph lipopolysaccharide-binding protein-like [Ylistrum balloti]|uniref:hemolymph lipopolysaccharide-binding protein-like n=1 Tax=Ylistrum balloti TaxID=509963 RepID=UPI00290595AD|nr:hemolymph lipopolysaccharide-binding protein-like [Ylistrum balloti]
MTASMSLNHVEAVGLQSRMFGTSIRRYNWVEDKSEANRLYNSSLTTTLASLITCTAACSNAIDCTAATYNNSTKECNCINNTTSFTSQLGNMLWRRKFDGFIFDAQLGWYIRLFVNTSHTHAEAESVCGNHGARLAVLDTSDKLSYVTGLPDYRPDIFCYVGAMDEQSDGLFTWSTGTSVTNWMLDEPNGLHLDEDCVAIFNNYLIDLPCSHSNNFVCEIEYK